MAYRLLLPKFGMAMQSAKIIEWMKEVGDYIEKEEAVLVVENEKLTNEICSMEAGVLLKKVAIVGEDYIVGDILAWLGEEGETVEDDAAAVPVKEETTVSAGTFTNTFAAASLATAAPRTDAAGANRSGRVAASPLAKRLAAELYMDLAQIPGTGPGGRIDKQDVLNYSESLKQQAASTPSEPPVPVAPPAPSASPALSVPPALLAPSALSAQEGASYTVVPYTGMRKAVGDNMQSAWTAVPMITHHVKADVGALMEIKKQLNDGIGENDQRISVNDMLLKLVAAALIKMPVMNATFEPDGIHLHRHVNLGMATALDNGLIVPVIHGAENKSLAEISEEAKALSAAARAGRLTPDNIAGGTFTVSNLGGYKSVDFFSPIINKPQVAILGVGRTVETVVPVGGEIGVRPLMGLSLTYDHRAIDGAVAALFMGEFMALLEKPLQALLR
jgi:pyruvate dehydrogenase E2 component (dihydrolipoamide acetyltransferase)